MVRAMTDEAKPPVARGLAAAAARKARQAEALRANLRRRKGQERGRDESGDGADDAPPSSAVHKREPMG